MSLSSSKLVTAIADDPSPASSRKLAAIAESVLEDHAELDTTVVRLRALCVALRGNQAQPSADPAALIAEFKSQLIPHFAAEQAEEFSGTLVSDQPRLLERVERLQTEHGEMAEALDQLLEFAQSGPPGRELAGRLTPFLDWFDTHEHAENALIQEFLLLDDCPRAGPVRVENIMRRDVSACSPNDTLERVAQVMAEHGCDLVAVLDESRHLLGMIRDRDLWMGAYRQRAPLAAVVASTAMSRGGVTCSPNEEIAAVAQRMQQSPGMRCAAVINERGEFLGLVTLGRIAACRYSSP